MAWHEGPVTFIEELHGAGENWFYSESPVKKLRYSTNYFNMSIFCHFALPQKKKGVESWPSPKLFWI